MIAYDKLQYNNMNIRRFKKAKNIIHRNQQQLAQDKLFQISYLNDQRYIDQSEILTFDHKIQNTQNIRRSLELQQVIQKKNKEIVNSNKNQKNNTYNRNQKLRTISKLSSNHQKKLFNTVESNQVFVGSLLIGKYGIENHQKEILYIETKKRAQTMPAISHKQKLFQKRLKTQKTQSVSSKFINLSQFQKEGKISSVLSKTKGFSNYQKLRQKLRYDLFIKTLNTSFK